MIASSPYLFLKMILLKINKGNYAQFTHKINLFIYYGILHNKLNNKDFAEYPVLRNLCSLYYAFRANSIEVSPKNLL